jgi:hypothetical protein
MCAQLGARLRHFTPALKGKLIAARLFDFNQRTISTSGHYLRRFHPHFRDDAEAHRFGGRPVEAGATSMRG